MSSSVNRDREPAVEGQQLISGIPDDITLAHISPKLPWGSFQTLLSVSRGWKQVIQSRQVYDKRVHSHSTETLILIHSPRLGLYSAREKSFYQLPDIPHLDMRIPRYFRCVSLDGRIYVLGGEKQYTGSWMGPSTTSDEVYVLDLFGGMQWRRCARMNDARMGFKCGVRDGKIYICEGTTSDQNKVLVPEVYDPKTDLWSRATIVELEKVYAVTKVTRLGNDLLQHDDMCYHVDYVAPWAFQSILRDGNIAEL